MHEWFRDFADDTEYQECETFKMTAEIGRSVKEKERARHEIYKELQLFHQNCLQKYIYISHLFSVESNTICKINVN